MEYFIHMKDKKNSLEVAVFGGGCFWCTEAIFKMLRGVISVASGYAGGERENPTYEEVSSGHTGHAEVIKIEYDPGEILYKDLLTVFFASHDPTTLNRQGADIGTQYRSIIFYTTDKQKEESRKTIKELEKEGSGAIVTEIKPLENFYKAEEYHADYYAKNESATYCQLVINPKLKKIKEKFSKIINNSTNEDIKNP